LHDGDIAFRCNLTTVSDGMMVDFSAGHIMTRRHVCWLSTLTGDWVPIP
jgi:2,3-bisphosphoglycerate-independent phosphoglycerate mutase